MSTKLSTGRGIAIALLSAFLWLSISVYSQADSLINNISPDSLQIFPDSLQVLPDTTQTDTVLQNPFRISDNAIDAQITYKASDSMRFDLRTQKVHMYKKSDINYTDINLQADYVEIEFPSNSVYATGLADSTGELQGTPIFKMSDNSFESEAIRYNYETKKGLVQKVITEDSEGYLHGNKVKKMPDNATNVLDGSYTTCELEHPHFEFRFRKARVIPENKIITGPAYLTIEDVPTPIAIPFGLFPNKKGQRSGIVIPTWGESSNRGFYFENGGYYLGISDYLDLKLIGDIYTLGSWAVKPTVNYRKRYKYSGSFNASYAINQLGEKGSPDYSKDRDFRVRWVHNQDPKAHPTQKFSANVNVVSSQYNKYNPASTNAYLSNTFQSSINYSRSWGGKYFLNTTLKHQQNTITRKIDLSLPSISFNVNKFYPLRAKQMVGKPRWYENISVNYNMVADNRINTDDTLLFQGNIRDKLKTGMKHTASVSSGAIKLLKHLVWTNSVTFNERWYNQKHLKSWNNDTIFDGDDPTFGFVQTDTVYGFNAVRDFRFNSSVSTTIFGMFAYKKGPVQAIRHVIKPSLSFSYRPDFSEQKWGYYNYYTEDDGSSAKYSPYDGFIYGTVQEGRSGTVGLSISNNLEMKVRNRKDTVTGTRKIVLIDNLSFSTGYNLARDSLNFDRLTISGNTRLFKNLDLNYSGTFDPYVLDSNGRRLNRFEINENNRLFRPESHTWRFGTTLRLNSKDLFKEKESDKGTEEELRDVNENLDNYVDWNVPWTLNISYNFNFTNTYVYKNGYWNYDVTKNKRIIQTLNIRGDINITEKWKVGFNTNYDFEEKEFGYTQFNVFRDLHCWQMSFNWIPLGFRQSWNFTINIKSALLQDLKLDKKKDFWDN